MLKCVITLYEESQRAIADSPAEKRITWSYIKTTLSHLIQKVIDCKFLVSTLLHYISYVIVACCIPYIIRLPLPLAPATCVLFCCVNVVFYE